MTPRERAYRLRDALRARDIALDVTAVDAVEAAILADRAERDAVRESACAAYERALAEQAAGEAERVREAVAAEREACAVLCETWTDVYPGASYARGCAARVRARATSAPAAAPHPASREACEAARAERAQGRDIYADGEGRCEVVPAPVAAERAVLLALVERAASLGRLTLWHGDDCPHRYCDDCDADRDDDCAAREGDECECSTWEIARLACDARDALVAARKGGG